MINLKHHQSFFWTIFLIINLITRGPDLYAYLNTPANAHFAGQASWFDAIDLPIYVSALRQGQNGNLLYLNQYDPNSNQRLPVYLFYTISGYLFQWLPISPWLLFHLLGICTSFFLALVCYWVSLIFAPKQFKQTFILISLGSGIGWSFYFLFNLFLPDFTIPHFTLYSAWRTPHDGASLAAMLLAITAFYKFQQTPRRLYLILTIVGFTISGIIHAFLIIPLVTITSIWVLFSTRSLFPPSRIFLPFIFYIPITLIIYYFIAMPVNLSPSTSTLISAPHASPPLWKFLLSFSILLPFAFRSIRQKRITFLIIWFLVQTLIIYFPVSYQRLMIRGWWIPFSILTVHGLSNFSTRLQNIVIGISLLGTIVIPFQIITHPSPLSYFSDSFSNYLKFLNKQEPQVVLSGVQAANIVPAFTNHQVVVGHAFLSPNSGSNISSIKSFYQNGFTQIQAQNFLTSQNVSLVYYGSEEISLTQNKPLTYSFLQPVWQSDKSILYLVYINGQN